MKAGFAIAGGAVGALALVVAGYVVFQATRAGDPVLPANVAQPVTSQSAPATTPPSGDISTPAAVAEPGEQTPSQDATDPASGAAAETAPVSPDAPGTASDITPATPRDAEGAQIALADPAAETPRPGAAMVPLEPRFDVVRIDPDGNALVAGAAFPGAIVHVLTDGAEIARTQADAGGSFVVMFPMPPSVVPRILTLGAELPGTPVVMSSQNVIISPAPVIAGGPPVTEFAPVAGMTGHTVDLQPGMAAGPVAPPEIAQTGTTGTPEPETGEVIAALPQSEGAPDAGPADAPVETATVAALPEAGAEPGQPSEAAPAAAEVTPDGEPADVALAGSVPVTAAPTVLLADETGIRVLQDGGTPPEALANVTIDSISYDTQGEVQLAGRGQGDATVRVYLNNAPIKTTRIAENGQWRTPLPEVESGVYTLRVDEIAADGSVTSRSETPFQREAPETLAAVTAETLQAGGEAPSVQAITVQPGHTLWAIAQRKYGSGFLYVRVFEANRDLIRDPHWIYPGQVFALPGD